MNILAIGASSSSKSINRKLAAYAAVLFENTKITLLDLNDFEMPIFSVDKEKAAGNPVQAQLFLDHIAQNDIIVLSLAEHNGAYSTAFKNILDWASRINGKVWQNKAMLLMATSDGARGGKTVLEIAKNKFPFMGADIKATYSLPSFKQNFDIEQNCIIDDELDNQLKKIVETITEQHLNSLV